MTPEQEAWGRVAYLLILAFIAVVLIVGIVTDAH